MNYEIKGLDSLVKTIAAIKASEKPTNLKLLVIGKGNQNKYQKMANDLHLQNNIIFAGVLDREVLADVTLRTMLLSCCPSSIHLAW